MGLDRSLNICFHTCKMQVIVSALLLSPCCKNHNALGKLAVIPEVLCQYKAVVSLMAFSWFFSLPEEGTQLNYYVSLQGESLRDSSHPIFSCSRTTSKLWWTTVGSYSLAWPQCKLWNTPRLPSGTIFWHLKGFFSRYVAMGTSWDISNLNFLFQWKTSIFIVVLVINHIVDICPISYSLGAPQIIFIVETFSIPTFFLDSDIFGFSLNSKNVCWAFD